jgi:hypothetical protein
MLDTLANGVPTP